VPGRGFRATAATFQLFGVAMGRREIGRSFMRKQFSKSRQKSRQFPPGALASQRGRPSLRRDGPHAEICAAAGDRGPAEIDTSSGIP